MNIWIRDHQILILCHFDLPIFRYAFAFQIDSPYIELFNREMLIMQERGMIKDLWHKFVKGNFSLKLYS